MPHDATPRNGRMHEFGMPGWIVALALGYGIYAAIAASRRRARFDFRLDRLGVIRDRRMLRRGSRFGGRAP